MTGRKASNENVQVGRHGVILKLMFVVDLHSLLGQNALVADIVFVAVMKLMKLNRIVKFFDLGLVGFLPELSPHGIQHHLG